MAYINDADFIRMLSKYTHIKQSVLKEIRDAECLITKRLLEGGNQISFGDLGKFRLRDMAEQKERTWKNPHTNEIVTIESKPPYQKPMFQFSIPFKAKIRERALCCLKMIICFRLIKTKSNPLQLSDLMQTQ